MSDFRPMLLTPSARFCEWLGQQDLSIAFTTSRSGDLFLVGVDASGGLFVVQRSFDHAGAVHVDSGRLWLATRYQVWEFGNILPAGQFADGCDRVMAPLVGHTTGGLRIQQFVSDASGEPVFVDSLFSTVGQLSRSHSFKPIWSPSFITGLTPDDRCHLSGAVFTGGKLRFATVFARTDSPRGWKVGSNRNSGSIIDAVANEVVADGLNQPCSPLYHDGWLWLLEAGCGHVGRINPDRRQFEVLAFCPGYVRGFAISGQFGIVGVSKPRPESPLAKMSDPRCGIYVIDLRAGTILHWLRLPDDVAEISGVAIMQGVKRASLLGFQTDEVARVFSLEA